MVSIAKTLKAKADESEVLKTELERTQSCYQSLRQSREAEDLRVQEFVNDLQDKQSRAADDVRDILAEVYKLKQELSKRPSEEEFKKLKEELANRPSEEEVLKAFRASEAYFLNTMRKLQKNFSFLGKLPPSI